MMILGKLLGQESERSNKEDVTTKRGQRSSRLFWLLLMTPLALLGLLLCVPQVKNFFYFNMLGIFLIPRGLSFNTLYAVEAQIMVFITVASMVSSLQIVRQSVSATPNILKEYLKSPRVWMTFAFWLFTFFEILGSLAMSYSGYFWSGFGGIFLLVSLILVGFHFAYTMQFVDPVRQVHRLSAQIVSEIGKIPQKLETTATLQEAEAAKCKTPDRYKCLLLQQDEAVYGTVIGSTLELFDLLHRTAAKRESETYSVALSALADSAVTYLQTCGGYIAVRDKFTEYMFEQLNNLAQIAIRNGDSILLGEVVATYEKISLATIGVGMVFIRGESPYLTTVASQYLRQIAIQANNINFLDSCRQAIRIMGKISEASIERCEDYALVIENFDNIIEIVNQSLDEGEWFATSVAVETLSRLFATSVKNTCPKTIVEMEIDKIDSLRKNVIKKLHPNIANTLLSSLYEPVTGEISPYNFKRIVKQFLKRENPPLKVPS